MDTNLVLFGRSNRCIHSIHLTKPSTLISFFFFICSGFCHTLKWNSPHWFLKALLCYHKLFLLFSIHHLLFLSTPASIFLMTLKLGVLWAPHFYRWAVSEDIWWLYSKQFQVFPFLILGSSKFSFPITWLLFLLGCPVSSANQACPKLNNFSCDSSS